MSTIFGVAIDKEQCGIDPTSWRFNGNEFNDPSASLNEEYSKGMVQVAFLHLRANKIYEIHFINLFAHLLPDETPILALDNIAHGFNTIGDIKRAIKKQKKEKKNET